MRVTEVLATGFYFPEDPRWHDGRLWFSDFFGQAVHSVSPDGDVRTEAKLDDWVSGLGWMPDRSLLMVSMQKQQVLRRRPDGGFSLHADLSSIAGGQCNDMVVDREGRAYVGNFGFDLYGETLKRGVDAVFADHPKTKLACVEPDGTPRAVADDMDCPNGTVITPDGRTLIISETFGQCLTAFDIGRDGGLLNRRVWASVPGRGPDGIALNADGNIWMANCMAPECVLVGRGGRIIEIIDTRDPCYACMLGGDDGQTLFMLIAPTWVREEAMRAPKGRIITTRVETPHAGLP